jgi:hypothetical protein
VGYIKPTEAERASHEAKLQEIASAIAAAMTNPWQRQTATFIPDDEPKPRED